MYAICKKKKTSSIIFYEYIEMLLLLISERIHGETTLLTGLYNYIYDYSYYSLTNKSNTK